LTTNWNIAGYEGGIPCYANLRNAVTEFGIDNTGATNVSGAVESALQSIDDNDVLFFPNGTYLFNNTISVPSNRVLRGESPIETKLLFNLQANANMIDVSGTSGIETAITDIGGFGEFELTVSDATGFSVGDDIEIEQENEPDVHYTNADWNVSWAQNIKGQILKIAAISGNTITVDRSFTFDYNISFAMTMRKIDAKTNVGFENFYIERVDANTGLTNNNFLFYYSNNCWIRRVHSYYTARYHVRMEKSRNIELRECEIEMADDCGGGGAGYGVLAQKHTEDCLIEDNIFHDIRHPLIVKEGVSRNVYAYNYCFDIRNNASCDSDPANPYADISLHGHYPAYNLFEGNIVGRISSTDHWGPAGPGNTFFRNRVTTEKGVWTQEYSHEQVFVANELVDPAGMFDNRDGTVNGTVLVANTIQGVVDNEPTETVANSLYRNTKPEFFGNLAWPAMGYGTTVGSGVIPAQQRWLDGVPMSTDQLCSACLYPDMGTINNLCGISSINLSTNLDAINRTFTWFKDNIEIPGENQSEYTVLSPGTYKIIADSLGCVTESEIVVVDYPVVNLPEDFTLCSPSKIQLDADNSNLPNVTYTWSTGATAQTIDVISEGSYSVTVSADGCGTGNDEVTVTSELIDVTGDELTAAGTANLTVNEAGVFNWYTQAEGGASVHTGTSYSPNVTESTYFWVENANGLEFNIGNASSTLSNGYYNSDFAATFYYFDVLYPITLNSVMVYAEDPQTVVITIKDSGGNEVGSVSQAVDAGEQVIELNIELPVGTNYSIDSEGTTDRLWREKEAGNWDYTEAGYMTIHSTEPAWIETNGYYAFWYNWQCTAGNPCDRTPVLAEVSTGTNVAPSVSLITPIQDTTLPLGYNLQVSASATDIDGTISDVKLYIDNQLIRSITSAPYEWGSANSPEPDELNNLAVGTYTIKVAATDNQGASTETSFTLTVTPLTQTIELTAGWNLVSTYLLAEDMSVSTLFPNATIVKTDSLFFNSTQPSVFNTITEIEVGKGYLVYNSVAETLYISGSVAETEYFASLHDGWNLIGCPYSTSTTFETAFGSELNNIQSIKSFEGSWINEGIQTINSFEPGKAYYILK